MIKAAFKFSFFAYLLLYFTKFYSDGEFSFLDPAKVLLFLTVLAGAVAVLIEKKKILIVRSLIFFAGYSVFAFLVSTVANELYLHSDFYSIVYINFIIVALTSISVLSLNCFSFDDLIRGLLYVSGMFSLILISEFLQEHWAIFFSFIPVRYTGTFRDPNYFSLINILNIAVATIFYARHGNGRLLRLENAGAVIIIISNVFFLLTTYSRTGFFAGVIFLVTIMWFSGSMTRKKLFYNIIFVFVATMCLWKGRFFLTNIINFSRLRFINLTYDASALSRIYEIQSGVNFFIMHPFRAFVGIGTGVTGLMGYWQSFIVTVGRDTRIHNTYVALLIENGVFGFSFFMTALFTIFRKILKLPRIIKGPILGLFLANLTSALFIWNVYFLPFWLAVFIIPVVAIKDFVYEAVQGNTEG